ncbi:aaa ATPase domain containing protein [Niveomyces insectorum RCEF 264]|uniref:Aaa ATPase domain containing protein n=1 Tax=Niveomyces insectorum RCEF 264 TaxID=1081102 RepID=A0A167QF62_9HYPO|nr:aaa ATPase domain containing protein [Niveomyces insectorum RCEF 264]
MSSSLVRPAFGHKAVLGTLYDAHTDNFQDMSTFSGDPLADMLDSSRHREMSVALSYDDSYKGRFDLLGVGPELGASILSGLAPAKGPGRCFYETNSTAGHARTSRAYAAIHHRLTTAEDSLKLDNPALRKLVDADRLELSAFTHVVFKIEWGCQTVITVRSNALQQDDDAGNAMTGSKTQAAASTPDQAAFTRSMDEFKKAVDELQYLPDSNFHDLALEDTPLDITAYSEMLDEDGVVMDDLQEAFDFVKLLPSLVQHRAANGGKGEPISYTLLPIRTFMSILQLQDNRQAADGALGADNTLFPVAPKVLGAVLEKFDEVTSLLGKLVDYSCFLANYKPYTPSDLASQVGTAIATTKAEMTELMGTYASLLAQIRTSTSRRDELELQRLANGLDDFCSCCATALESVPDQQARAKFASAAVARGAVYIGHNGLDLDAVVRASAASHTELYVFRFSSTAMAADEATWALHLELLEELLDLEARQRGEVLVVVLDSDAVSRSLEQAQIAHYDKTGRELTQDLYQQRQFEANQSFAWCDPAARETGDDIQRPVKRCMVKMPCPAPTCDGMEVCHWICAQCHSQIEFGYADEFFYCDCGRAKFNRWRFKCNGASHPQSSSSTGRERRGNRGSKASGKTIPSDFVAYNNRGRLLSTLKSLDQADYVNILILGETGVGKSTFINSFVNYISFASLDEAKRAEELNWVIPCAFSIQTIDRSQPNGAIQERKIHVGNDRDDEQDGTGGASATQQTAVYPVNTGSRTIRLIDTPGIGDTRGLAYDKKNMADILRTLSGYEQLHGILILLKSNNARLTVTFNFCMQELLTHLHRSTSRNMAFGFTNTRISNYSPGDTFGPLSSLLAKHKDVGLALENQNTYCFDSESFRFLAAFKSGVVMDNEEDFRRSWEHSRGEAVRLVDFFASRTPHLVKSTMSLNGTRQLIAELTKPMADISQTISTNIAVCHDRMNELRDTKLSGDKLRQRLQVPKVHLRTVPLRLPRTVCRNEACVEWRDDGTGVLVRVYKKPCHDPCYLDNVEVDRVNCPELLGCAAFHHHKRSTNICQQTACGHSWQEHLHIYFELEEYTALVTDTEAQRLFEQNESDILVKQTAIHDLEQLVDEYKLEHTEIQEAAARFGVFLKHHSITPFNDATLEYLDMLIQEEEQKARVSRDEAKVKRLREDKVAHIELVATLEKSMTGNGNGNNTMLDEAGVEGVVRTLYSLTHFGEMLHDVKNGVTAAHQATYRERPVKVKGRNYPSQMTSLQKSATSARQESRTQTGPRGSGAGYRNQEGGRGIWGVSRTLMSKFVPGMASEPRGGRKTP